MDAKRHIQVAGDKFPCSRTRSSASNLRQQDDPSDPEIGEIERIDESNDHPNRVLIGAANRLAHVIRPRPQLNKEGYDSLNSGTSWLCRTEDAVPITPEPTMRLKRGEDRWLIYAGGVDAL